MHTTYTVIDTQTGRMLGRYSEARNATDRACRMNAVHGAARYAVRLVLEVSK